MLTVSDKCDHCSWSYFPSTPLRTDHVMVSGELSICLFIIDVYICTCSEWILKETVPFFSRGLYWESKLYKLKRLTGHERLNNLAILWRGRCVWGLFWGGLVRVNLLSEIVLFSGIFHYNCIYSFVTCVPWSSLFLYLALSSDCLLSITDNIQRAVEEREYSCGIGLKQGVWSCGPSNFN